MDNITNKKYANRGKFLENIIDMTNNKYRNAGIADIRKVPTPVKILKQVGNKITGHTEKPMWTDYLGIYKGDAIIFDAKQTAGTSFPLSNVAQHQYELLKSWHQKGAFAFLIIYFSKYDKYYYLSFGYLEMMFKRAEQGGRKSIAFKEFELIATEVKNKDGYTLHYLEVLG